MTVDGGPYGDNSAFIPIQIMLCFKGAAMAISPSNKHLIDQICKRLSRRSRVLFITGAGMSADSGLPTYRGLGGLYNRELTDEGVSIEEALSGEMLRRRPELCWKYLSEISRAAMKSGFNRGHRLLAEMEEYFAHTCILTQNIDGYHRAAGSQNVIEIHGDLRSLHCTVCSFCIYLETGDQISVLPRCPECRSILRPDVVLFGEQLPEGKLRRLSEELRAGFDMVCSIGTSSVFPYIMQPVLLAGDAGWMTVEINPDNTAISQLVEFKLPLGATEALEAIRQGIEAGG